MIDLIITDDEKMDITSSNMTTARSEHDLASKQRTGLSHSISHPAGTSNTSLSKMNSASRSHSQKNSTDKLSSANHLSRRFAKLKRRISRSLNKLCKLTLKSVSVTMSQYQGGVGCFDQNIWHILIYFGDTKIVRCEL